MALTRKIPQKYALNIIFWTQSTMSSSVAQWCGRLPGGQAVRVQASAEPFFLRGEVGGNVVVVCFFIVLFLFCFFLIFCLFVCFSFTPTANPYYI